MDNPAQQENTTEPGTSNPLQIRRRRYVIRMLVLPLVLTVALVALLGVGREMFHKRIYLNGMRSFATQMETFKEQHQRWPGVYEVRDFEFYSRMPQEAIHYEDPVFPIDCEQNLPVAWSPATQFTFLDNGRVVLMGDGTLQWIDLESFAVLLKQKEQYRNAALLKKTKTP